MKKDQDSEIRACVWARLREAIGMGIREEYAWEVSSALTLTTALAYAPTHAMKTCTHHWTGPHKPVAHPNGGHFQQLSCAFLSMHTPVSSIS